MGQAKTGRWCGIPVSAAMVVQSGRVCAVWRPDGAGSAPAVCTGYWRVRAFGSTTRSFSGCIPGKARAGTTPRWPQTGSGHTAAHGHFAKLQPATSAGLRVRCVRPRASISDLCRFRRLHRRVCRFNADTSISGCVWLESWTGRFPNGPDKSKSRAIMAFR